MNGFIDSDVPMSTSPYTRHIFHKGVTNSTVSSGMWGKCHAKYVTYSNTKQSLNRTWQFLIDLQNLSVGFGEGAKGDPHQVRPVISRLHLEVRISILL